MFGGTVGVSAPSSASSDLERKFHIHWPHQMLFTKPCAISSPHTPFKHAGISSIDVVGWRVILLHHCFLQFSLHPMPASKVKTDDCSFSINWKQFTQLEQQILEPTKLVVPTPRHPYFMFIRQQYRQCLFGYGPARYPAVTCWVGNFLLLQSVTCETP